MIVGLDKIVADQILFKKMFVCHTTCIVYCYCASAVSALLDLTCTRAAPMRSGTVSHDLQGSPLTIKGPKVTGMSN
jgi:hypothetical protein